MAAAQLALALKATKFRDITELQRRWAVGAAALYGRRLVQVGEGIF
jgi:hypothetical protein